MPRAKPAHSRRAGNRQNPHPHPPDCAAAGGRQSHSGCDPGHHFHQQGRPGNARTTGSPHRRGNCGANGYPHLPRLRRITAARGGRRHRHGAQFHHPPGAGPGILFPTLLSESQRTQIQTASRLHFRGQEFAAPTGPSGTERSDLRSGKFPGRLPRLPGRPDSPGDARL